MDYEVKDLKKDYGLLVKKYNLPSFEEINENFEIEKIGRESECLLRNVRKVMMEKIVNSLGFVELLLNPINAPRMYLLYLKSMTLSDRKEIEKIYVVLSEIALSAIELEINYDEKKEAEMIKLIFEKWNSIKPLFMKIVNDIKKPKLQDSEKGKTYFG